MYGWSKQCYECKAKLYLSSAVWLKIVAFFFILVTMGLHTLGLTHAIILIQLLNDWIYFFGNAKWCVEFLSTKDFHLPMMHSDHAPILAVLNSLYQKPKKPFRFENWWLFENDFHQVANRVGTTPTVALFSKK
jgi:hypothetical protein